jgi:hypothetical protein
LRGADADSLSHFCDFAGLKVDVFGDHIKRFFNVDLRKPGQSAGPRTSFRSTYVYVEPAATQNAFLIYGLGVGNGYRYWLNNATKVRGEHPRTTLEEYFARAWRNLKEEQRVLLGILIVANPAYDPQADSQSRGLLREEAQGIANEVRRLTPEAVNNFCRWNQIDVERFRTNVADLVRKK